MRKLTAISHLPVASSHKSRAKSQEPLADKLDRAAEFKRGLALFFIGRGHYKITDKAYGELAIDALRQSTELMEVDSAKERSSRVTITRKPTKAEIRELVRKHVALLIADQGAEVLYYKGYIGRPAHFNWEDKNIRIIVIKKLIETVGKEPKEITAADFNNNGLSGLLATKYDSSPYLTLVEARYAYSIEETKEHARTGDFKTDKVYPWEMMKTPWIYGSIELRIAATKWLAWKLKKDSRDITRDDFYTNGLGGLLSRTEYKGSPYLALLEAGLVTPADEAYIRERGYRNLEKRWD